MFVGPQHGNWANWKEHLYQSYSARECVQFLRTLSGRNVCLSLG